MPRKKAQVPVDPDKLVRQEAGTYRTADERFEVRGAGNRWFLVDGERTDELGQELVRGPLPTLEAVREAIPEARREDIRPLPTGKTGKKTVAAAAPTKREPKPKATPPLSWIDRLPRAEATQVRVLIRALEREGVNGAEQLVRRDRDGLEPAVAAHLLQRRLAEIVDEFPPDGRAAIQALVDRVVAVLSEEGGGRHDPLPGWLLVEVGPQPEPDNRRIRLND